MNSPEKEESDAIDPVSPAEPAAAGGAPPGSADPEPRETHRRGGGGWIAWLILIALVGAGGYFGYPLVKQQLGEVQGQRALLEHLNKDANDLERKVRQIEQAQASLGNRLDDGERRLEQVGGDVRQLSQEVQGGRRGFQLAAVEQLLLAANDQLQLAGDVRAARVALEEADRRLATMDDPALIPVRQALSSERAALAALPEADVAGPVLVLAELIRQAPSWPLRARAPSQYQTPTSEAAAGDTEGTLGRLWISVKRAVSEMFTVRRTDGSTPRLLPPGEEALVVQALSLKLEGARLAVLAGEPAAVREMCLSADQWLEAYYNVADARVAGARKDLRALAASARDAPARPDISGSLSRLRGILEQRSVR